METDSPPSDLVLPEIYNFSPLRALRMASRRKLSGFLDLEGVLVVVHNEGQETDVVNDYSGLAELAGFNYQDIMNMKRQRSPSMELLDLWTGQNGTVGKLWMYLFMMERFDVLIDCRRSIVQDCMKYEEHQQLMQDAERYNIEQDPTVSTSEMKVDETKFATKDDVDTGKRTFYDAFICYTAEDDDDRKFLFTMIKELEVKRGLKLFVPGRDDLPGAAEYTVTAYLIEKRCRRVVILMSRKFLQSAACDFQVKFAHALAPGARSKKLIPIIREKNTPMPRILRFLAVCDFTKSDMVEWVWDRLNSAIIAPVGPRTYFEEEDSSDPFEMSDDSLKDIKFPSQRRLGEHDENASRMDVHSGAGSRPDDGIANSQTREPVEYDASTMSWGRPTPNALSSSSSSLENSSPPTTSTVKSIKKGAMALFKSSKSDKSKSKKESNQRQQPSSDSKTITSSNPEEHFV